MALWSKLLGLWSLDYQKLKFSLEYKTSLKHNELFVRIIKISWKFPTKIYSKVFEVILVKKKKKRQKNTSCHVTSSLGRGNNRNGWLQHMFAQKLNIVLHLTGLKWAAIGHTARYPGAGQINIEMEVLVSALFLIWSMQHIFSNQCSNKILLLLE